MTPHQEPTQAQKRRLKTLDYIRGYFAEHRYGPTMAEIKSAMNISSFAVVAYQLDRLEEQGYLTRQTDQARGIILKDSWGQSLQPLPVVPVIGALRRD